MGIWDRIFKSRTPVGSSAQSMFFGFPANWNTQQYIQTYGQVGWVYACVSRIAQSVGEAEFHLYEGRKENATEIEDHPLLDLLKNPNPFQTGQESAETCQTFLELSGEWIWLIFRDGLTIRELWPVNPQQISIVPHPTEYISGYVFTAADGQKVPLKKEDVFFLKTPNPANLYRGMGIVQSIMTDIEGERYAALWNRNFFINGGSVGDVIEAPGTISDEDYQRLKTQYRQGHEGVANAFKLLILQGGAKYNPAKIGQKEMDFANLRGSARDIILGAFGMPPHILGVEASVNRSTAESAEYVWAKTCVSPRLKRRAAKINQFLLPQFPNSKGLWGRFEDPTPEDKAFEMQKARDGFMSGFITRNEARTAIGLNELGDVGDVFLVPINLVPQNMDEEPVAPLQPSEKPIENEQDVTEPNGSSEKVEGGKSIKANPRWDIFVKRLTPMEQKFADWVKGEFKRQEADTLAKLTKKAVKGGNPIYDTERWARELAEGSHKYLRAMVMVAGQDAAAEVGSMWDISNPRVLEWLGMKTRKFGVGVTDTIARDIEQALKEAYGLGESIPQITERIQHVFDVSYNRATTIARTEMVGSSNWGALEGYRQSGVVREKEWLAADDERTRETHAAVSGTVVALEEDFIVGSGHGPCPGQIGLPEEDINCRCAIAPVIRRE